MVIAAYEDSLDIARAEADPRYDQWPQPISPAHKAWRRSNLVSHADLADMLRVPAARIHREARSAGWPEPVIDRPRKHWYWWPHLKPALASRGLFLSPDVTPPAVGPAPSYWGSMPAEPWFPGYLRENLMDFTGFAQGYYLSRARSYPDYPEPVISRPGNYRYWAPDLDPVPGTAPGICGSRLGCPPGSELALDRPRCYQRRRHPGAGRAAAPAVPAPATGPLPAAELTAVIRRDECAVGPGRWPAAAAAGAGRSSGPGSLPGPGARDSRHRDRRVTVPGMGLHRPWRTASYPA